MRKQKLNKRGNIYLRNFLEFSPSSVLNTVGDVTIIKEVAIKIRNNDGTAAASNKSSDADI